MKRLFSFRASLLTFLAALAAAAHAHAHPGHGVTNPDSPAHLLEPVHFVKLLAGVCIVGLLTGLLVFKRRQLAKARADRRSPGAGSRRSDD